MIINPDDASRPLVFAPNSIAIDCPYAFSCPELAESLADSGVSEELIAAFVEATRRSVPLDARRVSSPHPLRAARRSELEQRWPAIVQTAEDHVAGIIAVSGIGYSDDLSQALVLVHSQAGASPGWFQFVLLLDHTNQGWRVTKTVRVSTPIAGPNIWKEAT